MPATVGTPQNFENNSILSIPVTDETTLWVLYYRQGSNPHSMSKQFYHSGTLPEIIARCKNHCEVMGYRFTNVRPAISDLAQDEARHINS